MKFAYQNFDDLSQKKYKRNTKDILFIYSTIIIIIFVLFIAFTWLFYGKVDVIIETRGIISQKNPISKIYNMQSGILKSMISKDQKEVYQGDCLFSIENTTYEKRKKYLTEKNIEYNNKIKDLKIIVSYLKNKEIDREFITDSIENEFVFIKERIQFLREKIRLKETRIKKLKNFRGISISEVQYNQEKMGLINVNYELSSYKKETIIDIVNRIENYKDQISSNVIDKKDIDGKLKQHNIHSPIDGRIQFIEHFNIGDYIPAGKLVMKVVPISHEKYIVRLVINNDDILRIKKGDIVRYRITSYPYKEFGTAKGKIISINYDVTKTEGQNYIYEAEASINNFLNKGENKKQVDYVNGMITEASIIVGQRSIIYYVLEKLDFIN